jgi:hypothetical protein
LIIGSRRRGRAPDRHAFGEWLYLASVRLVKTIRLYAASLLKT